MRRRVRQGFTLVETIIVLVLVLILSAAVIVGVGKARERSSESDLAASFSRVELAERSYANAGGAGAWSDSAQSLGVIDGITVSEGASNDPRTVSIFKDTENSLWMAIAGETGCQAKKITDLLAGGVVSDVTVPAELACDAGSVASSQQ